MWSGMTARRSRVRTEWRARQQHGASHSGTSGSRTIGMSWRIPVELAPAGQHRVALVCTMCDNAASFDSFVCYYLGLGFHRLYLYADDKDDPIVQLARRYPSDRLELRVRGDTLRREWSSLPSWRRLAMYAETEVQARQQLNCEHALAASRAEGVVFLLHLDSDELLHVPFEWAPDESVDAPAAAPADGLAKACAAPAPWRRVLLPARAALRRHLARLDQLGALQYTYLNHEAVPEQEESVDPFLSVSLFKRHPSRLPPWGPAAERAMRHWTGAAASGGQFFGFYTNGKSIVRADYAPITTVASVHEWTLPPAEFHLGFTNNADLSSSPYVPHHRAQLDSACEAAVLHFAVCSFSVFWRKRWAALGYASPNHRFRGVSGGLDQRANALAVGRRRGEARELYARQVMLADPSEARRQVEAGVCVRIDAASAVVAACREAILREGSAVEGAPSAVCVEGALGAGRAPGVQHGTRGSRGHVDSPQEASWHVQGPASGGVPGALGEGVGGHVAGGLDDFAVSILGLPESSRARAAQLVAGLRQRALASIGDDAHLRALASCAVDAAAARACGFALKEMLTLHTGGSTASSPGSPSVHLPPADPLARAFELLLTREAQSQLRLLPARHLLFDLAGYWTSTHTARLVSPQAARELLSSGVVVLPQLVLPEMLPRVAAEAEAHLARAARGDEPHCSAAVWLHSPESPPRAPPPSPTGGQADPSLFGRSSSLGDEVLVKVMSAVRGVCAALEETAGLRLALPRSALYQLHTGRADGPAEPLNTGWPDTGLEVCCMLSLDGPATFRIADREGRISTVSPAAGCPLLILARSTACVVEPAAGGVCSTISAFAYSSWLRTADGLRVLGASEAVRSQLEQRQA